ncbi:MAG: InlB B-repeat-containing protein [Lachnospiraceae bacterium]|nr:InlB B-repeat-containing protein [Lachnospiraceae bacterium]
MNRTGFQMKRMLAVVLALVMFLAVPLQADAISDCEHRGTPTEFDYRRVSNEEGEIETWARCKDCGDWYYYCGPGPDHDWYQKSVSKTTCTTDGSYTIECRNCGAQETTITEKAPGHRFGEWKVTKEAACLEDGERQHTCEECRTTEKEAIPAKGAHSFGEWQVTKPASCTEAGEETHSCSACKEEEKREIPATEHAWSEWKVTKPAGCKEAGEEKRSCETCKQEESRTLPATDHDWSEWIPTKQAGHGQQGEEERSCSVCNEKETRPVDGEKPLAQTGSQGLVVLAVQELLTLGGEYAGETDGVMREDLADAIRSYERASNLPETGAVYPDTLQLLTERYVASYAPLQVEAKEVNYASGLQMVLQLAEQCTSNGDGSHKNAAVVTGVRYLRNEEEMMIALSETKQQRLAEVTEGCLLGNESHTCSKCGYHEEFDIKKMLRLGGLSGWTTVTYDLGIDLGLGDIENISYDADQLWLRWKYFENAAFYEIEMVQGESTGTFQVEGNYNYCIVPEEFSGWKEMAGTIQALNENKDPVSNKTAFSFELPATQMPEPEDLTFVYGRASWNYPHTEFHPVFHYTLTAYYPVFGDEEAEAPVIVLSGTTTGNRIDLAEEMTGEDWFPYGTQMDIKVYAADQNEILQNSAEVISQRDTFMMPSYIKAVAPVSVYEGPGKSYQRIGGLKAGDCVRCWGTVSGEDGTYCEIDYHGTIGFVDRSFAYRFLERDYTVTLDLMDGRVIELKVDPDGRLSDEQIAYALEKCTKYGYWYTSITKDGNPVDWKDVMDPGTVLVAHWKLKHEYVLVTHAGLDGVSMNAMNRDTGKNEIGVPVRIGDTCQGIKMFGGKEMFQYAEDIGAYWVLYGETGEHGKTVVTRNTVITRDMAQNGYLRLKLQRPDEQDFQITTVPRSPYDVIYDKPDTAKTNRIGTLQAGDLIRLYETVKENGVTFCRIYSYRLNRECYVLEKALNGAGGTWSKDVVVRFDADGGWCDVKLVRTKDGTLGELPAVKKDGYTFMGWLYADGRVAAPGQEISGDVTLKAKWKQGSFSKKRGVTTPDLSNYNARRTNEPDYNKLSVSVSDSLYGGGVRPITPGLELTAIDEFHYPRNQGDYTVYQCILPDGSTGWIHENNICFDYSVTRDGGRLRIRPNADDEQPETGQKYIVGRSLSVGSVELRPVVFDPAGFRPENNVSQEFKNGFAWYRPGNYGSFDAVLCVIRFDALQGSCHESSRNVTKGKWLNELPKAERPGYDFVGWFTKSTGGEQITKGTKITESMTLYAQYTPKAGSGSTFVAVKDPYGNTNYTHIYQSCTASSRILAKKVPDGSVLTVLDEKNGADGPMLFVEYGGVSGWVMKHHTVSVTRVSVSQNLKGLDKKHQKQIRKDPKNKKAYREYEKGETLYKVGLYEKDSDWAVIAWPDSETGFAYIWNKALTNK